MNAIRNALNNIKFTIPKQILEKAFMSYTKFGLQFQNSNIDEQIKSSVIIPRVLVDCDLVGGVMVMVPLAGLETEQVDGSNTVIRIPKSKTQGRSINSALSVCFVDPTMGGSIGNMSQSVNYNSGGMASTAATAAALAAMDIIPIVSTARVQLIGENVILIKDNIVLSPSCYLRCMLANDQEMSNIPLRSYIHFNKLVEYAVKSYIYNEMIVSIDQGQLMGGVQLGAIKEIISGYSDAEQNYQDYLRDVWTAVAFMSDDTSYNRFAKLLVGGNR